MFSPTLEFSLPQACLLRAVSLITAPPEIERPRLTCRPRQRMCAHCREPLPWRNRGRPQAFCSTRCQRLASREKAYWSRVEGWAGVVIPDAVKSPDKNPVVSISCKAANGHLYPCFNVPLTIFGSGHRWPGAPRLEAKLRRRIIELECAA